MTDHQDLLGRTIAGKFQVEERIGRGAMGEVFRARHIVLGSAIALKIMRPDLATDSLFKERFYREARAASRLDHPNSVRVLDFGVEEDGLVYIAMELLHGRDLLSVLRAEWPLPDSRIVDVLVQTLAALSVAHELGIVHRDLKPENIMVAVGDGDGDGEADEHTPWHVKVLDFGIAKLSDPRAFSTETGGALTSSGTLIGTPEYMSPEQSRGDSLDARSDIYSIGIILYQLLVGRVPFTAENALGVVLRQVTDAPVPPGEVRPGVNPRLEAICLKALAKSRDERYQTAREMRRDLRGVFGYQPGARNDESAPHLAPAAARAARARAGSLELEGAPTIVQSDLAASPLAAPAPAPAPKQTHGGTELTVSERPGPRYLGLMAAIAAGALLVGVAVVVLVSKRADGDARSNGAAASARSTGSALALAEPRPDDTPLASPTLGVPLDLAEPTSPIAPHVASARHAPNGPGSARAATSGAAVAVAVAGGTVANGTSPSSARIATTAPPASAAPAADYNPSGAYVALGALTRERVRAGVIEGKLGGLLPRLSDCYRDALRTVGSPVGGSAEIHMSIDERGGITAFVNAPKLPQFARCAQQLLAGQTVDPAALDTPASAGATASQWLTLHP